MPSKRIIFYAITRNQWTSNNGFAILAVTSQKNERLYGTYFGNSHEATDCRESDMKAKFNTIVEAELMLTAINNVYASFMPFLNELEAMRTKIQHMRKTACTVILNGR